MKTKQHNEAIKRMKQLKFDKCVFTDFEKGIIHRSEVNYFADVIFLLEDEEKQFIKNWQLEDEEKQFIKNWQEETGNLAYHIIKNNTEMGMMYSILYVSKNEDEWAMEKEDISEGKSLAYCGIDLDNTFFEYGLIGISPTIEGVQRTW